MASDVCDACGTRVEGDDMEAFVAAYIVHVRADHKDWPFPDTAIRNYAEATQRLSGGKERLDQIGDVVVEPVTEDRIDDWLRFFDHDAFADNPAWAACYCAEPHFEQMGTPPAERESVPWQQRRQQVSELLRTGGSHGYLAYVDGKPGGWVNASKRSDYALYRLGASAEPADGDVIGISCFVIAPPYRRHGLAAKLLERVLADAPKRGVAWVEAYPVKDAREDDAGNFRGPTSMYDDNGFEVVEDRDRYVVVRRPV
jgi:GNAT superfamily N-acetyltransferase